MNTYKSPEKAVAIGLLVASAIIALGLDAFWQGYQLGGDLAHAHVARQSQEVIGNRH